MPHLDPPVDCLSSWWQYGQHACNEDPLVPARAQPPAEGIAPTRAWNWRQGCMLQWIPGRAHEVIWNDCDGDRFVARICDVCTRAIRTLPNPIYNLSPDGCTAIAPDFRRLNDVRPGYGYAGIVDPRRDDLAPADTGLWRSDLISGKQELLFSFSDARALPFAGRADLAFTPAAKHWFNHLLFNADGTRFFFLHRWREPRRGGRS